MLIRSSLFRRCLFTVAAVGGATLLALTLRAGLQPDLPGQISSPLLLGAVALTSRYAGLGPGCLSALLALLSLEYLFLPPLYDLGVDTSDLPRWGVFLGASLLVGQMTAKQQQAEFALDRKESQLRAARLIQQRLLPHDAPRLPGYDIAGRSHAADSVGGDYFDYLPMCGGSLGLVVGDSSGHGISSALLMAETQAYLRALALTHDDAGEILTITNRILAQDAEREFITLFLASLEPEVLRLTYAGAGHEAYLLQPDGSVQRLPSTSLPLGLQLDLPVPCAPPVKLRGGQILLMFTDGVWETRDSRGQLFGIDRSLAVVQQHRDKSAAEILSCLHAELRAFAHQRAQEDDLTMIAVKIAP